MIESSAIEQRNKPRAQHPGKQNVFPRACADGSFPAVVQPARQICRPVLGQQEKRGSVMAIVMLPGLLIGLLPRLLIWLPILG